MNLTLDQEELKEEQRREEEVRIDNRYLGYLKEMVKYILKIVLDCTLKTLRRIITGKIEVESVIYSDSWRGYDGLVDVGYDQHFRIKHYKDEFSDKKGVHINGIESFWSYTKRRLTKFNGVKKSFDLHLKECEWRWSKTHQQLTSELTNLLKC
jgi:transposase